MPPIVNNNPLDQLSSGVPIQFDSLVVLAGLLTVAVYFEIKENRIPNWLTLSGMTLGLIIGYLHIHDADGHMRFASSIVGLVIGFGFLFIFYVFGGIGGGDVKLMGAAGTLMGGHLTLIALFYTAIIGAFLAVMMTVWRKDFWAQIAWGFKRLAFWHESKAPPAGYVPTTVPYGLAIAIGCLVALLLERPVA